MVSAARRDFTIVTTSCSRYGLSSKEQMKFLLKPLDEKQSVEVLKSWYHPDHPPPTPIEAKELAKICGGLPVYLEKVGAALDNYGEVHTPADLLRYMKGDPIGTLDEYFHHSKPSAAFGALFQLMDDDLKRAFWCLSLFPGSISKQSGAFVLCVTEHSFAFILTKLMDHALIQVHADRSFSQHQLIREFAIQEANKAQCEKFKKCQERLCSLFVKPLDSAWQLFPKEPHRSVEILDGELFNVIHFLKILPGTIQESQHLYNRYIKLATVYEPMLRLRIPAGIRMQFYEAIATEATCHKDVQNVAYVKVNLAQTMLEVYQPDTAMKCLHEITTNVTEDMCLDTKILYSVVHSQILCAENRGKEAAEVLQDFVSHQIMSIGLDGVRAQFDSNPVSTMIKIQLLLALGEAHFDQHLYSTAIQSYRMVTQLFESAGVHSVACTAVIQMGRCYFYSHDYKESRKMFLQALNMQETLRCDQMALTATKYHVALTKAATIDLQELSEAETELKHVVANAHKFQRHHLQILAPHSLGKVQIKMASQLLQEGQEIAARKYLERSLESFSSILTLLETEFRDSWLMQAEALAFHSILKFMLDPEAGRSSELQERCQVLTSRLEKEQLVILERQPLFQVIFDKKFPEKELSTDELIGLILPANISDNPELDAAVGFHGYYETVTSEGRQRSRSQLEERDNAVMDDSHTDAEQSYEYPVSGLVPSDSMCIPPSMATKGARRPSSVQVEKEVLSSLMEENQLQHWKNHQQQSPRKHAFSYPPVRGQLTCTPPSGRNHRAANPSL